MQRRTKIAGAVGAGAALVAVAVGAAASGGSPTSSVVVRTADPVAAQAGTSYPGTVPTTVSVSGTDRVRAGQRQALTIDVQVGGDAEPQGQVTVVIVRQGGSYREEKTLPYLGEPIQVQSSSLGQAGQYTATASFDAPDGSVYQDSDGSFSFQVIGKGSA